MRLRPQQLAMWISLLTLCGFTMIHTNCAGFAQGLQDLTEFCKAVGKKCTQQTAADCTQKLGAKSTKLKASPDYAGAKACVDALETCDELPNSCWLFAAESLDNPTEDNSSESITDAGE